MQMVRRLQDSYSDNMKYLILSDIHGNAAALRSVLAKLSDFQVGGYVVLGDLVGYGANPDEVVSMVRRLHPVIAVRGNHDRVAAGVSEGWDFNPIAKKAIMWTRENLSRENKDYIAKLPKGPIHVDDRFSIVHGSPWDEDCYLFGAHQAQKALSQAERQITFFGHTHVPVIWSLENGNVLGEIVERPQYEFFLKPQARYLINPGSVGQPRDGNSKAAFAVFDMDNLKLDFFRVCIYDSRRHNLSQRFEKMIDDG